MKMVPPTFSSEHTSRGEIQIFQQFEQLSLEGATCYHSYRLSEHETKPTSEIDFVVLTPGGLLVIEVKSGGIHHSDDGLWYYKGKHGVTPDKKGGPFVQAEEAMWALRELLAKELGMDAVRKMPTGWAVAFPHVTFTQTSPEWKNWQVYDQRNLGIKGTARFLHNCIKQTQKRYGKESPPSQLIPAFEDALRSEFHVVPSLASEALRVKAECLRLTKEQRERLALSEAADRLVITGGAGTGKTVLALEMARSLAAINRRVILLVPSRFLVARLRNHEQTESFEIREFEERPRSTERAEVLIVDEAQDVLDNLGIDIMDDWVVGGILNGQWRIFLDDNFQAGLMNRFDPTVLDYLKEAAAGSPHFKQNCRNTAQVVQHVQWLTGGDIGVPTIKDGAGVDIEFFEDRAHEATLLEEQLVKLVEEGDVPPGDITILSSSSTENSCINLLPDKRRKQIKRFDQKTAATEPFQEITIATPHEFKGFENSYICLVDNQDIGNLDKETAALYVALSRARAGLWVTFPQNLRERVKEVITTNLKAMEKVQGE